MDTKKYNLKYKYQKIKLIYNKLFKANQINKKSFMIYQIIMKILQEIKILNKFQNWVKIKFKNRMRLLLNKIIKLKMNKQYLMKQFRQINIYKNKIIKLLIK